MTLVYRNLHQSLKLLMWLQLLIASVNGGSDGKASVCNTGDPGFDRWVGKIPWRRKWQPTPVFLPGKSHGPRSLVGYHPLGSKESDTTERLHFHFQICTYRPPAKPLGQSTEWLTCDTASLGTSSWGTHHTSPWEVAWVGFRDLSLSNWVALGELHSLYQPYLPAEGSNSHLTNCKGRWY